MNYFEFHPHHLLKEYIKCFWILQKNYSQTEINIEKVYPDSYYELIYTFGQNYSDKDVLMPNQFLIGILDNPLILKSNGLTTIIGVRMFPWGTIEFLKHPLKNSFDKWIPIDFYNENLISEVEKLVSEGKFNSIPNILNELFLEKLMTTSFTKGIVQASAQILYRQRNTKFSITELAELCFSTPRTIQRNFKNKMGLTPINYSNIVRFDIIKKELAQNLDKDLSQLAFEHNFFDQAHFSKEFKKHSGETPSEFILRVKSQKEALSYHNVVLLQ